MRRPYISLLVEFFYGQKARLYLWNKYIMSVTGVQQGDLLSPLLFYLVVHPFVHKIRGNCKLLLHILYLVNGTIIWGLREMAKALDIMIVS